MKRLLLFLRELRWLAIIAFALAVLSLAYAVYVLLIGDALFSIFGVGFSGLIMAWLAGEA